LYILTTLIVKVVAGIFKIINKHFFDTLAFPT